MPRGILKDPSKYKEWKRNQLSNLIKLANFKKDKTYEEIYGEVRAEEIRKKASKKLKGHPATGGSFKKGNIPWNKGLTKEIDQRMAKSAENMSKAKKGKPSPNKGKTFEGMYGIEKAKELIEKGRIRRAKQILPKIDTKIEVKIQMFLEELGYEYFTHQYMKHIEHAYQCDILIPALNLVIECDGDYWHKYPIGTDIDHIRTKELIEKGFKVLRLWGCEIKIMDINKFKEDLDIIKEEVKERYEYTQDQKIILDFTK